MTENKPVECSLLKRITIYIIISTFLNSLMFPSVMAAKQTAKKLDGDNSVLADHSPEQQMNQVLMKVKSTANTKMQSIQAHIDQKSSFIDNVLDVFGLSQLTLEDLDDLEQLSEQLQQLNTTQQLRFAETETAIIEKGLSETILNRHKETVQDYEANYQQLLENLHALMRADSLHKQLDAAEQLNSHLQKQKFSKGHQSIDPENLPWGTPDPKKTRAPVTTKEELTKYLGSKKVSNRSIDNKKGQAITDLQRATAIDPIYLQETADARFTESIRSKAAELNHNPVDIYNWVRNNIEYIPSYGSIQGADYTLQTGKGNAFDTASLLIALLRSSGIPARYVFGTVTVPADQVMNWVGGVNVPEAAQQLLGQGGVPNTALTRGGIIQDIRLEHVWVESWVDFFPSRGAKQLEGDSWIPLDASFKQYTYTAPTLDTSTLSYDGQQVLESLGTDPIWDATAQSAEVDNALDNFIQALDEHVDTVNPNDELSDLLGRKKLIIQEYDQFASSLPYTIDVRTDAYSELPANLRHKVKYTLQSEWGSTVFDYEISLPEFAGNKLSVSFTPSTNDDKAALESFVPTADTATVEDLPDKVPGYLIDLSAQLNLSGSAVKTGGSFRLGQEVNHQVSLYDPTRGWVSRKAVGTAGEYRAIGIDLQGMSDAAIEDIQADLEIVKQSLDEGNALESVDLIEKLTQLGIYYYFTLNDYANQEESKRKNIVEYRLPSFGFFHTTLSPSYYFGMPQSVAFSGVTMDVPHLSGMSYSKDNIQQEWINYNRSKGPRASYLENWVPEEIFNYTDIRAEGISAAKIMDLALAQGQQVHVITSANLSDLQQVSLGSAARRDIINSVNAGKEVTVHSSPITLNGWTGSGYLVIDPQTGAGGYIISGGANGGFLGIDVSSLLSLLSLGIDFIPGVGTVKSLIEFITGRDLITGEPVNRWVMAFAMLAGLIGGAALVKGLAKAASKASKAGKLANKLGKAGEAAVRSVHNIGKKNVKIKVNGRNRIPDGLSNTTLSEIKNTAKQSYTKQLKDFGDYAKKNGLTYDLYVRGPKAPGGATKLTGPLNDAIQRGDINLKYIPGTY